MYVLYYTLDFQHLRKKQRRSGGWKNLCNNEKGISRVLKKKGVTPLHPSAPGGSLWRQASEFYKLSRPLSFAIRHPFPKRTDNPSVPGPVQNGEDNPAVGSLEVLFERPMDPAISRPSFPDAPQPHAPRTIMLKAIPKNEKSRKISDFPLSTE